MKFEIPGKLPGLNEVVAAAKRHFGSYSSDKKRYTELVSLYARKMPQYGKINITITWIEKNEKRDKDNISGGGTKFILDGLVLARVILNDTWKYIGNITHRYEVDKQNPRIEVELEEVAE